MARVFLFFLLAIGSLSAGVHWQESGTGGTAGDRPAASSNHATRGVTYTIDCDTSGAGTVSDIQWALDDRWRGDTIVLNAWNATRLNPCVWKVTSSNTITLRPDFPRVGLAPETYTRFVPSSESSLPPLGIRVTPRYKAIMPTLMSTSSVGTEGVLVMSAPYGLPALQYFEMRGINITIDTATSTAFVPAGIQFGPGSLDTNWWPGNAYGTSDNSPVVKFAGSSGACGKLVCAGDTTFSVASALSNMPGDPTQYLSVGMKLFIGNKSLNTFEYQNSANMSHPDGQVITALTPNTITVDPSTPMLFDHTAADVIEVRPDDIGVSVLPQYIRVRQCVFSSDFLHLVIRWMSMHTRDADISDNFVEGAVGDNRGSGKTDAQAIWTNSGTGPYNIENNYLNATGEPYMDGGGASAMDVQASGTHRRNIFIHIPERDRTGPWGWVLDPTLKWTSMTRYGARLVMKGRTVHKGSTILGGTAAFWMASNTGVTCATEPTDAKWTGTTTPVVGDTVADCGVTWSYLGTSLRKIIKNNWELKKGKNITAEYNVMEWMYDGYSYNVQQVASVNVKASSQQDGQRTTKGCGAGKVWPDCRRVKTSGIVFRYNLVRSFPSALLAGGALSADAGEVQDWDISNNLWIQTEPAPVTASLTPTASLPYINVGGSPSLVPKLSGLRIDKNTFYSPFSTGVDIRSASQPLHVEGNPSTFPQGSGNSFTGNILVSRSTNGFHSTCSSAVNPEVVVRYLWPGTTAGAINCSGVDYTPVGGGKFGKNIIGGAKTSTYDAGTVLANNCPNNTASCAESWVSSGGNKLFRNVSAGNFVIDEAYAAAKAVMADGSDVGADILKQPLMNNFRWLKSDKQVLLLWDVNPPIGTDRPELNWRDTPCIAEIMTGPDIESPRLSYGTFWSWVSEAWKTVEGASHTTSYAGEWANMTRITTKDVSGYNYDSDKHSRNVRNGLNRMISIGQLDPLTPVTDYWGRVQCGGDTRWFDLTTDAALSGTGTLTGSGITEWGTVYDRSTDTITDSHVVSSGTATGVTKGIVYYRQSGTVQATVVKK